MSVPGKLRIAALLWLVTVLLATAFLARVGFGAGRTESSILALLPDTGENRTVRRAVKRLGESIGERVIIVLEAADPDTAAKSAQGVESYVRRSGIFSEVSSSGDLEESMLRTYFPRRESFLGPNILVALHSSDPVKALTERVERILSEPMTGNITARLAEDPLLLFPDFLLSLGRGNTLSIQNGYLMRIEERSSAILFAKLRGSPFDREYQMAVARVLGEAKTLAEKHHVGTRLLSTGLVRYAERATSTAEHEIAFIGFGSLLGVIVLLFLAFRSLLPLLLTMLAVAVGMIVACAGSFLVFDRLHLITLGFGASLIGIGVDHGLHFFCHQAASPEKSPFKILREIFAALFLGITTTILGFVGLLIAPFPGLNQIAFFSITGLTAAFFVVVLWFPFLSIIPPFPHSARIVRWARAWLNRWRDSSLFAPLFVAVAILLVIIGATRATIDDDIRLLDRPDPGLRAEERVVRRVIDSDDSGRAFFVTDTTLSGLFRRESALVERLDQLERAHSLKNFRAISRAFRPPEIQQENLELFRSVLVTHQREFVSRLKEIGFRADDIERFFERVRHLDQDRLSFEQWLEDDVSRPFRPLYLGKVEDKYVSLITLSGIEDEAALRSLADGVSVAYIDQVGDTTEVLRTQRRNVMWSLPIFYGFVFVVMLHRYGARRGTIAFFPALIAGFSCIALSGFTGAPVNLFSLLAIIIVLGIGVDFSIFLVEGEESLDAAMAAIALSVMSSLLSLGLLALCSSPVLRAFGQNLFVGTSVAMLLAPIVIYRRRGEKT